MNLPDPGSLDLASKVAQLFCLALPTGDATEAIGDLRRHAWGGYLFDSRRDRRERLEVLREASPLPLLLAADLERGAGQHLSEATTFPHAMAFGATGDPDLSYQAGRLTALEARAAGLNWVMAPIADLHSNPLNPIIGVRSYGSDPALVAACVGAFVAGCQAHGVVACAKHFPGHGDTAEDSHSRLAVTHASRAHMQQHEWQPFREAIARGVGSIMTAHMAIPAIDPTGLPATLCSRVLMGALRGELDFSGVIVSDALNMGGITETFTEEEAAVQALRAGCDVLLMPPHPLRALQAILAAIEEGELPRWRIEQSFARVWLLKRQLNQPMAGSMDLTAIRQEAAALADRVAREALTLIHGGTEELPGELASCASLVIDDDDDPSAYRTWLARHRADGLQPPDVLGRHTVGELNPAPGQPVVVALFSTVKAWKGRVELSETHVSLLERLHAAGHPLHVISFSNPYLAAQLPHVTTFMCAYSDHPASQEAAWQALAKAPRGSGPRARPSPDEECALE